MKPLFIAHSLLVRSFLLGLATLLVGNGCDPGGDGKITVYRIPKETAPQPVAPIAATAGGAAPAAVHWTAPESWQEQPASGFRKGSYLVRGPDGKTADISIISFPETAGGLLANVNRWRNQLKLPPITNVAEAGTPMPVAGRDLFFVDLVSEEANGSDGAKSRILGGVFPLAAETWFFKMTGPDAVVEAQRATFRQFLSSVHPAEGGAAEGAHGANSGPSAAPMSANAGGNTNAPTPPPIAPAAGAPLQYQLPPGWTEKPLTPMRLASLKATSPNGKETDLSIVSLPGMAGGDLLNVNRWRGQVQLAPIEEDALAKDAEQVKANGHDYRIFDLVSAETTGEKQRILAAILDENGHSWFIKMTGEDAAVAAQRDAFKEFLRGLQIPKDPAPLNQ